MAHWNAKFMSAFPHVHTFIYPSIGEHRQIDSWWIDVKIDRSNIQLRSKGHNNINFQKVTTLGQKVTIVTPMWPFGNQKVTTFYYILTDYLEIWYQTWPLWPFSWYLPSGRKYWNAKLRSPFPPVGLKGISIYFTRAYLYISQILVQSHKIWDRWTNSW